MALLLVRLRLTILRRGLRRNAVRLASFVIGLVLTVGASLLLVPGLFALSGQHLSYTSLTVALMAMMTLLWGVLSVVAFGADETLDPARFAVLPVQGRELVPGLLLAAFLGLPAGFLVLLSVGQLGAWASSPATMAAAGMAALLGVPTSILFSRVTTTALARVMSTRRGREVGALVVSVITTAPLLLNLALTGGRPVSLVGFDARPYADVLGWTPFGWAWSLPYDLATGRMAALCAHAALAVALVGVLAAAWAWLLDRSLTSPLATGGGQRVGRGGLLPKVFGVGPVGAVATRRVRAWRRDSRLVSIATRAVFLPAVFILQGVLMGEGPSLAAFGAVSMAIFGGLTLMNDLAFDGDAWWLHVAAGAHGYADRLGRILASAFVFGPITLVTFLVSVGLDLLDGVPTLAALTLSTFLTSLGVATLIGSLLPGTAPQVGANPFAAQSGAAAQGCLSALTAFAGPMLLTAPVALVASWLPDDGIWAWAALPVALAWGATVIAVSVRVGGRHLERTGPEMLQRLIRAA